MDTVVRIIIALSTAFVMLAAAADVAGQEQVRQREQVQQRTQERAGKWEIEDLVAYLNRDFYKFQR